MDIPLSALQDSEKEVIPTSTCFLGMFSLVVPEAIR